MPLRLRHIPSWLRPRAQAETSRLIVGSTGSGKSEGELVDLVSLAERREHAVVLLDGHGPLTFAAAGHWAARGHEPRLVYEPLDATDRVLCWEMLPRSDATDRSRRLLEDAEMRDEAAQCFMAQRNVGTLNDRPWTKEWLEAAVALCLAQPMNEPLGSLLHAFRAGSAEYERLLAGCSRPDLTEKFRALERLRRKNEVQYEIQVGAARRLLETVCASEVVRLRSRGGPFDWLQALRDRRLVAFDGGGVRSNEIKRTLFLLVTMQVIHAVRRHFAETRRPLPVVLVLEEAGALGLVTPFVLSALQELRKAGLSIHLITQSALDFGDVSLFQSLLANTPWQCWYQCLSPADQEVGAKALSNATFHSHAVHYTRARALQDGVEKVETASHGRSYDPHTHAAVRHDGRVGTSLKARYTRIDDPYFKSPQLHEQEYRTRLATLRIGERLVRDRDGVRRERVKRARAPWGRAITDDGTRALIKRVRASHLYLPCVGAAPEPTPEPTGAATRLRTLADGDRRARTRVPASAAPPDAGG